MVIAILLKLFSFLARPPIGQKSADRFDGRMDSGPSVHISSYFSQREKRAETEGFGVAAQGFGKLSRPDTCVHLAEVGETLDRSISGKAVWNICVGQRLFPDVTCSNGGKTTRQTPVPRLPILTAVRWSASDQ